MVKVRKVLIAFAMMTLVVSSLNSCNGTYNPNKSTYQLRYGFPVKVPYVKRKIRPIDDFKERMTIEAYNKVSIGISIVILSIAAGLFFSNPITNRVSSLTLVGGAVWALIGFLKLFVATNVVLLMWVAATVVVFGLIYRLRKRSITKAGGWIKCILQKKGSNI
jgi:hypothetical protein